MRRFVLLLAIAACGDNAKAPETGCVSASECPGTDTDCAKRTCDNGACGIAFKPAGTPTTMQVAGDCRMAVCDGSGNVTSAVDDTDAPDDHEACTSDLCTNGAPSNPPLGAGTACGRGLEC